MATPAPKTCHSEERRTSDIMGGAFAHGASPRLCPQRSVLPPLVLASFSEVLRTSSEKVPITSITGAPQSKKPESMLASLQDPTKMKFMKTKSPSPRGASKAKTAVAKTASKPAGTVALTIDYSNGARKSFAGIPSLKDMDALDVLKATGSIRPGLEFEFKVTLISDRVGRQRGFLASIDGVKADQKNHKWLLWINDRFVGGELATNGQFGPGTAVQSGDVLLLKLVTQAA